MKASKRKRHHATAVAASSATQNWSHFGLEPAPTKRRAQTPKPAVRRRKA